MIVSGVDTWPHICLKGEGALFEMLIYEARKGTLVRVDMAGYKSGWKQIRKSK